MYNYLDTPPPLSIFQPSQTQSIDRHRPRPWSPDPYDPLPSTVGINNSNAVEGRDAFNRLQRHQRQRQEQHQQDDNYAYDPYSHDHRPQQQEYTEEYPPLPEDEFPRLPFRSKAQRREASEVSVEALDLADYARTLRARQTENPYPPFPFADSSLNSSASHSRQHPHQAQRSPPPPSRAHPPSAFPTTFVSVGASLSPTTTSVTHRTPRSNASLPITASGSRSTRRPFSLPSSPYGSSPNLAQHPEPEQEVDITRFPAWSRGWYNNDGRRGEQNRDHDQLEAYELEAGLAVPPPLLNNSTRKSNPKSNSHQQPISPFDPAYIHPESYPRGRGGDVFDDNNSYPSYSAPSYNNNEPLLGYDSTREGIVPWSHDPPEYKPPLDPQVKQERIRMLEHEFGSQKKGPKSANGANGSSRGTNGRSKERDDGLIRDDSGKVIVGTPDGKGALATQGPRKRAAARFLQVVLAVAVGGPVVWAGVALKPKPPPPPAGKPAIYILYVLSPITLLLLLYFFVVRPCAIRRRYSSSSSTIAHPAAQGMMVLPIPGAGGGKKAKGSKGPKPGGKRGKKGKGGLQSDVQVNLIVDTNAFVLPGEDEVSSEDSEYDDGGMPGGFFSKANPFEPRPRDKERDRAKRKRNRRRTLLASLKLEEDWRHARSWLKKVAAIDTLGCLIWGVAFGFILAGKRCPTGGQEQGYGGWCTAYNASTAATCLLCVGFGFSLFFDVKDLYDSKLSPRTRV